MYTYVVYIGLGIRATLGDLDPLNKAPLKRAREPQVGFRRVPCKGVSLILLRNIVSFIL